MERYKTIINELKKERSRIWLAEPNEVKRLKKHPLAPQVAHPVAFLLIPWAGLSNGIVDHLWVLRELARKDGIPLDTLKLVTSAFLDFHVYSLEWWYEIKTAARLFREANAALKEITNKETYMELLGQLILYIDKLYAWVDLVIPWSKLSKAYTSVTK